jgi:hypothetical protein
MADWVTISSLATAGGTLALAGATYGAVRSSNRSARIAEVALQEQRHPVLVHSRLDDPVQKIMFSEGRWVRAEGSGAVVEEGEGNLYLALSLRNVGSGIAVLQGWHLRGELRPAQGLQEHAPVEEFRRQARDLYIPPGDVGIWQGALRDPNEEIHGEITAARSDRRLFAIDLLYTDSAGGQRSISRFSVVPMTEDRWMANVVRHWTIDGTGPR